MIANNCATSSSNFPRSASLNSAPEVSPSPGGGDPKGRARTAATGLALSATSSIRISFTLKLRLTSASSTCANSTLPSTWRSLASVPFAWRTCKLEQSLITSLERPAVLLTPVTSIRPIGGGSCMTSSGRRSAGIFCVASGSKAAQASVKNSMSFRETRSVFTLPSVVKLSRITATTRLRKTNAAKSWNARKNGMAKREPQLPSASVQRPDVSSTISSSMIMLQLSPVRHCTSSSIALPSDSKLRTRVMLSWCATHVNTLMPSTANM